MKSNTAQYYLFHTASSWGIERDQVHFHELCSIPFFLPESSAAPDNAKAIVREVAKRVKEVERDLEKGKWFGMEDEVASIRQELEPLIRRYYGITPAEGILIDDTLHVIIPSSTPDAKTNHKDIPTLRRVNKKDCVVFGETLCSALASISGKATGRFSAKIFHSQPYSIVQVEAGRTSVKTEVISDNDRMKKLMTRLQGLLEKEQGNVTFCQNLKIFDGDLLYIVKPTQYRFWMKSAALNDADEIAGAILSSKEGFLS